MTRARATSEAQQITAEGVEREAGAVGRAEVHIEALRVENVQRRLEAEAVGIEAKADALKKYNESATFLELARLHIEAERDIHIDQAQGDGHRPDRRPTSGCTAATAAPWTTSASSSRQGSGSGRRWKAWPSPCPRGLRDRLARDGIRGIFRRPDDGPLSGHVGHVADLVEAHLGDALDTPFAAALERLKEAAGGDEQATRALAVLGSVNEGGTFDDVPFATAWNLLQALARSSK